MVYRDKQAAGVRPNPVPAGTGVGRPGDTPDPCIPGQSPQKSLNDVRVRMDSDHENRPKRCQTHRLGLRYAFNYFLVMFFIYYIVFESPVKSGFLPFLGITGPQPVLSVYQKGTTAN